MKFQAFFTYHDGISQVTEIINVTATDNLPEMVGDIKLAIQNVAIHQNKECEHITCIMENSSPVRGIDISDKVFVEYLSILKEKIKQSK